MNNSKELVNLFRNHYPEISKEIVKYKKRGHSFDIIFNRIIKSILNDNHLKILQNYVKNDYFYDNNAGTFLRRIKLEDYVDEQGQNIKKYSLVNYKNKEIYTIYFYGYENHSKEIEVSVYKKLLKQLDEVEKESELIYNQETMLRTVGRLENIVNECKSYIEHHKLSGNIPKELPTIIAKTAKEIKEIYTDNVLLLLDRFETFNDLVKNEKKSYEDGEYKYLENKGLYDSVSKTLENAAKKIIADTNKLHNDSLNKGWINGKSILSKGILEIRTNANIKQALSKMDKTEHLNGLKHNIKAETSEIEEYAREGLYLKVSEHEKGNMIYKMYATVIGSEDTRIYEIDLGNKIYMSEDIFKSSVYKELKINTSDEVLKVVDENVEIQILPKDIHCKKYIKGNDVVYSIKNQEQQVYMSQKSFEDFIQTVEYFRNKILGG